MTTWRSDVLRLLSARVLRAPRTGVGCALALAALSALHTATHLQFQTDRMDNGIPILHRWRESRTGFMGIPTSTGRGVVLASLTTVVGFGSLMIARHRGVQSLGLLLALGAVCVLVASFTVLPGLLGLLARRRRAPAPRRGRGPRAGPSPLGLMAGPGEPPEGRKALASVITPTDIYRKPILGGSDGLARALYKRIRADSGAALGLPRIEHPIRAKPSAIRPPRRTTPS